MASNFLDILNQLHDHRVDFVIVGGPAASLHGGSRVTFDLDVVPSLAPNVSDGGRDCRRQNNNNRLDTPGIQNWINDTIR